MFPVNGARIANARLRTGASAVPGGLRLIREPEVGGGAGNGRRSTARPVEERVEAAARNQGDQRQNGEALHRRAVTTAIAAPASNPQMTHGACGPAATPVSRAPQGGEDRCCNAPAFHMIRPGAWGVETTSIRRFDSDRRLSQSPTCPES